MGIEVEACTKPCKPSKWMRKVGMTGSVEIGGNGGKGKKKKADDLASKPVNELDIFGEKPEVVKSSMPPTRNPEATKPKLEAASALASLKLKKAGKNIGKLSVPLLVGGARIVSAVDEEENEGFLDEDLSLASSQHPEAKTKSPLKEVQLGATAAGKTDKPDPVPAEPGKNVVKFLPKLGLVDSIGASVKFLMELQNTVSAAGEAYSEPPLLLRVDPLPEGSTLPPFVIGYNKAFGTDIKEKLLSIHVPESGEDDDPYNPPLLWVLRTHSVL
ncbi:hypothetical protein SETIT_4G247200v2 [Setaria italica]|uniref:Uncharacterized protein n=1 Tax=Setaria italica TaxID=4555 RepID=A0A368QXZ7_SETIT|nr:hypothetical protein SETIT_4G247200v2 [Setaria italica]